jgi:hypothetical protein
LGCENMHLAKLKKIAAMLKMLLPKKDRSL